MERIICLVIGYAFGLFQTAYIYGRFKGIDIRQHGSGNAGTTNTLRVLGTKAGLIVFAGDVLKCMLAVGLVRLFIVPLYPDVKYLLIMYVAAGAVLGHNYPFYLNFKGGKGIAATAGFILSFDPMFIPVGIIMFFGFFLITHYVSLGSLMVYLGFMLELIILGETGYFGVSRSILIEMYCIGGLLFIMAYWKHRENIIRLFKKEERKTYLFKKNKEK